MDQSARSEFALLHLDASDEKKKFSVEVISFEIEEALSTAFKSVVYFLSASPTLPFDDIVGRGAALSLHTGAVGDRVWAGVCTELELVNAEEHTGSPSGVTEAMEKAGIGGPNYKGRSRYRLTIQPDLYRLTLRKNCRIFHGQNVVDIVKTVLKDWDIEIDEQQSKVGPHPLFEYKVQYQESDFDFVSRMLEDSGISYWVQPHTDLPTTQKKKGNEITRLILRDDPANGQPTYDGKKKILPYLGDGPDKHHDMGPHMWMLSAKQQPRPLRKTIRDRDFLQPIDKPIENTKVTPKEGRPAQEGKYESYEYEPGAFWFGPSGQGKTDPSQVAELPLRRYQAELAHRTMITFRTNAMDIEPSTILNIGQDQYGYDHNHPHPGFSTDRKLLVIRRKITGEATGSHYMSELTAVYADEPYRPDVATPKPRIYGVQSAVVVGPKGTEIYTDPYGRVRVQFVWDRYGHFDADSSCWMRVSQSWAGGSFGFIAHPRIGHEVLVGFFEGDPDQPVVVGRVYNAHTTTPYFPATSDNATMSGIKTNSSPGGGGFNELSFQDKSGSELIHIQAQKDFSVVVNENESHDIGSALSYKVGSSESHDIGQSLTIKIGQTESHEMGKSFDIKVGMAGSTTEFKMDSSSIVLSTGDGGSSGKASITIKGGDIFLEATNEIHIHSKAGLDISTEKDIDVDAKGKMSIDTGDKLLLNCDSANPHPTTAAGAGFAMPPASPAHGGPGTAPFIPQYQGVAPVVPGGLEHVNVGDDIEEKKPEKPKPATDVIGEVAAVAAKAKAATGNLTTFVDSAQAAVAAVKAGNFSELGKSITGMGLGKITDIPGMAEVIKAAHGVEMGVDQLTTNINNIVKPVEDTFTNWMKTATAFIPQPVQDLLATKMGKDFMNGAVTKVLKDIGVPGGNFNDLANAGIDKLLGHLGKDAGKNAITKALFSGAVDQLHTKATAAFGEKGVASLIMDNFGGKAAKSTQPGAKAAGAAGAAAKAAVPKADADDDDGGE